MIDVKKQILYWQNGAGEELLNAEIMIENGRFLAGLFFCHLCIEKILKAHIVRLTGEHPPRTHNLSWFAEKAKVIFNEEQVKLISILQVYQLEGRYPETFPIEPDSKKTRTYYTETENYYKWLREKL